MLNRFMFMVVVALVVWVGLSSFMFGARFNKTEKQTEELTQCVSTLQKAAIQNAQNLDGIVDQFNGYIQQQKKGGK